MNNGLGTTCKSLLAGAAMVAAVALAPCAAAGPAQPAPHVTMPGTPRLDVVVRGDLYGSEVNLELAPGDVSPLIQFSAARAFRVRVTPTRMDERFGQIYALVLADKDGQVLEQMNIAGNTTATFTRYGVQVYLLSAARAV